MAARGPVVAETLVRPVMGVRAAELLEPTSCPAGSCARPDRRVFRRGL